MISRISVMLGLLLGTVLCSDFQKPLIETGSGINLGTIDDFGQGDTRIVESQPTDTVSFDDEYYYLLNMGLKNWGLVQLSMAMKIHPTGPDFKLRGPFCSISEETTSYSRKSELLLENSSFVYDYELAGNRMYVMASDASIIAVEISAQAASDMFNTATNSIKHLWKLSYLQATSMAQLGSPFNEAGLAYHVHSKILYVPTNMGLFAVDTTNPTVSGITLAGKDVYLPGSYISYCDIIGDYMFISFSKQGIHVYNVASRSSVKLVGKMDETFFKKAGKAIDSFQINDFAMHSHSIEIRTTDSKSLQRNPWKDTYFSADYTVGSRLKYIEETRWTKRIMFVAEKSGVFIVDIEGILTSGTMPTAPYPHRIPVTEVMAMSRFHDSLYLLRSEWSNFEDPFSIKSEAIEVFLYDYTLSKWENPLTASSDLFTVNRRLGFSTVMENIYADDNYFYIIGNSTSYLYERGVPRGFQFTNEKIGKRLYDPNIFAINKFVIDGLDYVLSVAPTKLSDFSVVVSDPHIRCPETYSLKNSYGTYEIQVNATTRHCPAKEKQGNKEGTGTPADRRLCLWTKTLRVEYSQAGFIEKKGGASVLLTLLLIVLCLSLAFMTWCYRRNKAMHLQYEQLKREIGTIRPSSTDENRFYSQGGTQQQGDSRQMSELGSKKPEFDKPEEFKLKTGKEVQEEEPGDIDYTEEA